MRLPFFASVVALASVSICATAHAMTYTFQTIDFPGSDPTSVFGNVATGINNKGQVVGTVGTAFNATQGFLLDLATGLTTILTNPTAPFGLLASKINDAGQILGNVALVGGFETVRGPSFLLDTGTGAFTTGYPASPSNFRAASINNTGQTVGNLVTGGRGVPFPTSRGYLLDGTTNMGITFVDPRAPTLTMASGLNDRGQVVGYSTIGSDYSGFLYDVATDSFTTLNDPLGSSTSPTAINNAGKVVGTYSTGFVSAAFVLDLVTNTYTTLTAPGAFSITPYSINDAGQIVGTYSTNPGGRGLFRAFLATPEVSGNPAPLPEPASLALLGSFVVGLGLAHRRKRHDRRNTEATSQCSTPVD